MCSYRRSGIIWNDSNTLNLKASVFKVMADRERVALLFGEKALPDGDGNISRLSNRIILNPFAAKKLAIALQDALHRYESVTNLSPDQNSTAPIGERPETSPLPLPILKSREAIERIGLLFELLKKHDLTVGLERSFKVSEKKLLASRFLVAFEPKSMGQYPDKKILDIGVKMDMPENYLGAFERDLSEATLIGFGIEEDETTCIMKSYLEFRNRYDDALEKNPRHPEPYFSHLGFKWDSADNTRSALARYKCFPALTARKILERISDAFYRDHDRNSFEILKGIVDLASEKVGHDKLLYLEVNEENNPRISFDINFYGANFLLRQLYHNLRELFFHYSIPYEQFHVTYDPIKNRTLGHVSGGIDRKGRDFLTVYFGE